MIVCSLLWCIFAGAASAQDNVFHLQQPDYALSPKTGMTRKHWKDAAKYLLEGAFSYVNSLDDPMKFPKQEGISYPRNEGQIPTEKLEGLCRTLFVAAPLLKEEPSLTFNGISAAAYYRYQIAKLVDPNSESFIKPRTKNGGPSQNLVEFGALAISLFVAPDIVWKPLPQDIKDKLAHTMISYGDGPTVPSNWKFFNIFVLSFFKQQGYAVNEGLMVEYLDKSLEHYRGDGWYNDNPAFDYYSMWAFQLYGTLWAEFFGKQHYPEYAAKFMSNFRDMRDNYPYLFSKNGEMIMWGRSITYRFGAVGPLPLTGLLNDSSTNYGWMRRISSSVLLQFLQNPDFLKDKVPTLGFYGAFEPAVQGYSCRGSAYWMGKVFLGLIIPEDNPFWTTIENDGAWETEMQKGKVYNRFQQGSEILITDYPNIGASEIRAWCHVPIIPAWEKFRGSENYNRLSYNSAFPWQADGKEGQVAMNYVFRNKDAEWEALRLYDFKKFEDGIYYRDVVLETDSNVRLHLADIPLANGILRVDQNLSTEPIAIRLGHYALPQVGKTIKKNSRKVKGHDVHIIDNGNYQLALVSYAGWKGIETVDAQGLHPVSDASAVSNVYDSFVPQSGEPPFYITLMLWKKSGEDWTDRDLLPVKEVTYPVGGHVHIHFLSGERKIVKYN